MLWGLRMPRPLPIGAPRGITAAQPTCSRRRATIGIVAAVGEDREAVRDQLLGGVEELDRVGQEGAIVADDLQLDP